MGVLKIGICALMLIGGLASPTLAQEVTLRLHSATPEPAYMIQNAIKPWVEKIESDSGGRIRIEAYYGLALGGTPQQLYSQAKDGVVDIIWTIAGYTPGRFPKAEVLELPFIMTNGEETSRAFHRWYETYDKDEFDDVHLLALHSHGPGTLHSNKPIASVADMKNLTIRGASPVISSLFERMGAETIGLPFNQVPEAISKGVIAAVAVPWEITAPLKMSELVKHHTEFEPGSGLFSSVFALVMNKNAYDTLSDDLKAVIDANSGVELAGYMGRKMDEADAAARKIVTDKGGDITVIAGDGLAEWKKAADAVTQEYLGGAADKQKLYDGIVELVQDEHRK